MIIPDLFLYLIALLGLCVLLKMVFAIVDLFKESEERTSHSKMTELHLVAGGGILWVITYSIPKCFEETGPFLDFLRVILFLVGFPLIVMPLGILFIKGLKPTVHTLTTRGLFLFLTGLLLMVIALTIITKYFFLPLIKSD
jgi:hypothetical protein